MLAKKAKSASPHGLPRTFRTLTEWKDAFLPELSKQEIYQSLRKNTEQLAVTLANDTFERVRGRKRI
jgi:hypothetical protein